MNVLETDLPGVLLVEPRVHRDDRGFFLETWHRDRYRKHGVGEGLEFVQDNHSKSAPRTLRGLHAQLRQPQGKLVRAIEGAIFDVAVDIRRESPTFGRWVGYELSAENFRQLWIPPGFAHGFLVLDRNVQVEYKCTELYRPDDEVTIRWNDPAIGVDWPLDGAEPLLSGRDAGAPRLEEVLDQLPVYPAVAAP